VAVNKQYEKSFEYHDGPVLDFSICGRDVATASVDRTCCIFSAESRDHPSFISPTQLCHVTAVALGTFEVYLGLYNGNVKVYERESATERLCLTIHAQPVTSIQVLLVRLVTASRDGKLVMWSTEDGSVLREFSPIGGPISAVVVCAKLMGVPLVIFLLLQAREYSLICGTATGLIRAFSTETGLAMAQVHCPAAVTCLIRANSVCKKVSDKYQSTLGASKEDMSFNWALEDTGGEVAEVGGAGNEGSRLPSELGVVFAGCRMEVLEIDLRGKVVVQTYQVRGPVTGVAASESYLFASAFNEVISFSRQDGKQYRRFSPSVAHITKILVFDDVLFVGSSDGAVYAHETQPIFVAIKRKSAPLLQSLWEQGAADPDKCSGLGIPPLLYAAAMDAEVLSALLRVGADVMVTSGKAETAVHYAAAVGDATSIRLLLTKERTLVNWPNEDNMTPVRTLI